VPVPRPRGPLRIKAVVDYIISQVGNTALGQLVVYRIFLRVPPQLLQAEDIASVHLVNDPSVVKTPILQKAIADSVMEVLKRPLPNNL
jgi:glycerol uptake facilitator-like aquaporin